MRPFTLLLRRPAGAALAVAGVAACTRTTPAPSSGTTSSATAPPATADSGAMSGAPAAGAPAAGPPAPPAVADAPAGSPFDGTRWVVVRVGDQRVITPTADPARVPHLVFDAAAGRVSGSGGCNRIRGPYRVQGDTLTVGPVAGTRMACPDLMATEAAFTAALPRVRGWRVVDGRLELLSAPGAGGEVVAAFTPAPARSR